MERADRFVPVHYGAGCGRIHSGVAGAGLPGGSSQADLPVGAADSAGVSAGRAVAAAIASGAPGAFAGDVLYSSQHVGNGNVRVCVSLVSDGSAGAGDLAGLPQGHRALVAGV